MNCLLQQIALDELSELFSELLNYEYEALSLLAALSTWKKKKKKKKKNQKEKQEEKEKGRGVGGVKGLK